MSRLNPNTLSDTVFVWHPAHVAYEPSDLRRPIANLRDQADVIGTPSTTPCTATDPIPP